MNIKPIDIYEAWDQDTENTIDAVVADISSGEFSTTPSAIINEVVYLHQLMDNAFDNQLWSEFDRLTERQVSVVEDYFRGLPKEQAA